MYYKRVEVDRSGGVGLSLGLLFLGIGVGLVLGFLFAPRPGKEMRAMIKEKACELAEMVKGTGDGRQGVATEP